MGCLVNREVDIITNALCQKPVCLDTKTLISPQLILRDYDAQVGEALANVKVMNKVIRLGMPVSHRIG